MDKPRQLSHLIENSVIPASPLGMQPWLTRGIEIYDPDRCQLMGLPTVDAHRHFDNLKQT